MAKILVIEDNESLQRLITQALQRAGHEVIVAADGVEGLRQFRAASVDIVITDIFMPDQDGIEILRQLRREGRPCRVIAMSGGGETGQVDILKAARQLGADRVLAKPFRMAELLGLIGELSSPGT